MLPASHWATSPVLTTEQALWDLDSRKEAGTSARAWIPAAAAPRRWESLAHSPSGPIQNALGKGGELNERSQWHIRRADAALEGTQAVESGSGSKPNLLAGWLCELDKFPNLRGPQLPHLEDEHK